MRTHASRPWILPLSMLALALGACTAPGPFSPPDETGAGPSMPEAARSVPGASSPGATTPDATTLSDGCGHRLVIETSPFAMRLEDDSGAVISTLADGGLRLGVVGRLDPSYNYDPWYFYQHLFPRAAQGPNGLTWLAATGASTLSSSQDRLALRLQLSNGSSADLTITARCPTAFEFQVSAETLEVAYVGVDLAAPQAERYYGLGEHFDKVEHRGRIRPMQFEVALDNEDYYNQAHVPVPLLISTAGWGVYVEDYHPGIFDVAKTTRDKVRIEYGARGLKWFWMAADKPVQLVETYTGLTGTPAIPPVWAFAPIHWRDEVSGQQMVLDDTAAIRAHGIPGSGEWLDRPYETYISSMDMDPAKFPDAEVMVSTLHATGFRLAGWNVPYMDPEDPDHDMAKRNGWFVGSYTNFLKFGPMMDLTDPEAMVFWQHRVYDAIDRGFEGWKLDYGEEIQSGIGTVNVDYHFWNGEQGDTMHHKYSEYYHQAYFEPYEGEDVFILSRAGTLGGHQYTSVIWPGDLCTNFTYYGEENHVGGLPAAVIAGTTLAASGYPFYASDTGGYRHGRASSEVLSRWVQYSAFLPVMQYGGCGDISPTCNPWDFSDQGDKTYTQQTLEIFRDYASLHTELFPLFYRLAEQARASGRPPVSAFGLYWPEDGRHPDDAFVVGDALLVAPLTRGGTSRQVFLPAGKFVDAWSGKVLTGPAELTVQAPLEQIPYYFLEGAIVPMLRPGVQTLAPVDDPSIDSYDTKAGRVWGFVVPAASRTSFDLPFAGGTLWAQGGSSISVGFTASATGTRHDGVNLRVYAPNATRVSREGVGALQQVAPGETSSCTGCFAREPGSPWLWIGVGDLSGWTLRVE